MERFLLIDNLKFFKSHPINCITKSDKIPEYSCILFINVGDNPNMISEWFHKISSMPYTYIILLGKCDLSLDETITIPSNIKYLYVNNFTVNHPIIKFYPMGCDFRSIESFSKADSTNTKRDILCYCNFSLNTHPIRKKIYDSIKNKSFITIENMKTFLNYSISRNDFFNRLGNSKFVICPRGRGVDTFRFYDTIYSGAIPIVIKENYHTSPFFEGVPILFLNNEDEFNTLTKEFLEMKYKELLTYKKTYYKGMDFSFFINELNKLLE